MRSRAQLIPSTLLGIKFDVIYMDFTLLSATNSGELILDVPKTEVFMINITMVNVPLVLLNFSIRICVQTKYVEFLMYIEVSFVCKTKHGLVYSYALI